MNQIKAQFRIFQLLAAFVFYASASLQTVFAQQATLIPTDSYAGRCQIFVGEEEATLAFLFRSGKFEIYYLPCYVVYLIEVLIYFAGGISVLFIVIGGYQYMIGGASDEKEKGKKTIQYALAGFIIAVLAWTIVNFVQVFLTGGGVQ